MFNIFFFIPLFQPTAVPTVAELFGGDSDSTADDSDGTHKDTTPKIDSTVDLSSRGRSSASTAVSLSVMLAFL